MHANRGPITHVLAVLGAAAVAGASIAGEGSLPTFTPPPPVTSTAWNQWYQELLAQRLDAVEFARDQTRYVSSSTGDDANEGLSENSAWQTLARAQQWLDTPGAETREVLFRRGDAWYATAGIISSGVGARFADYGDPELPRPYISGFADRFPVGDEEWEQMEPPVERVYQRPVDTIVYWVRQDGDLDLDSPLQRQSSIGGVHLNPGSWWYDEDSGLLYVHPRASDDAAAHEFAACTAEDNGFRIHGDLSLVENLRADGWGLNGNQREPFQSRVKNTDQVVFRNCVAYYGPSHVMAHFVGNGEGGIATFIDCTAGFTTFNSAGETAFNTYALNGGQETIFHDCVVTRGTLPSVEQTPYLRRAKAVFGHTGGAADVGLVVVHGLRIEDHPYGCGATPTFNDLPAAADVSDARAFVIAVETELGDGMGTFAPLFHRGVAYVNCRYVLRPEENGFNTLQPSRVDGWWINGTVDIDLSLQSGGVFALYNTSDPANHSRLWNSTIVCRNVPAGMTVLIDGDGSDTSPSATIYNTIFARFGPAGTIDVNLDSQADTLSANAYWQVPLPAGDANAVTLIEPPPIDEPPTAQSPLVRAAAPLPNSVVLEFDQRGVTRSLQTIGPLEAVGSADVDGNGVVDVADLVEVIVAWGDCPPDPDPCPSDINGDGVVNVSDLLEVITAWSGP